MTSTNWKNILQWMPVNFKGIQAGLKKIALSFAIICPMCQAENGTFDSNHWLTQNGQPFLPIGIYSVPSNEIARLRSVGFNVISNPFWAQTQGTSTEFLDAISRKNTYGIIGFEETSDSMNLTSSQFNAPWVKSYVNSIKRSSKLMAYYLPDEPIQRNIEIKTLERLYNTIKAADSNSIIILNEYIADAPVVAKNAYDVFSYDFYPIGTESIATYRTLLRDIISKTAPKPTWICLQSYVAKTDWEEPTRAELWNMAYLALVNGAKGFLVYQHGSNEFSDFYIKNYPALWENLQNLISELSRLSNILVFPETPNIKVASPIRPIDWSLRKNGNTYYLIGVNYASSTLASEGHFSGRGFKNVKVSIPGFSKGTATIIGGDQVGKKIAVNQGIFTDSFSPYGTKVYSIQPTDS
jgi:hypothetical protein